MNNLRLIASLCAVLGTAAIATGCTDDNSPDATLTVENRSDFSIVDLRVAFAGGQYGSNLLNDDLLPNETITLGVACDTYDATLIDEDNVPCTVHNLDLCLNDARWIIRNDTCTAFGAAKVAREAAAAAAASSSQAPASTR